MGKCGHGLRLSGQGNVAMHGGVHAVFADDVPVDGGVFAVHMEDLVGPLTQLWHRVDQVRAAADGAFGTGDVQINNNCSLEIASGLSDTIDNGSSLYLNGTASSNLAAKLVLYSNETVKHLWIDGVQQDAGVYTNSESWLSGPGELTVLEGAPVPTLIIFR